MDAATTTGGTDIPSILSRRPDRPGGGSLPRAVLFDLDDTLFDHHQCAREALRRVHAAHTCFADTSFSAFERAHATHLEELHRAVLAGALDIDAARIERFRRLFVEARAGEEAASAAAAQYREAYVSLRRAIEGAHLLLEQLRAGTRIGVVSNNLLAEQRDKIAQCGLAPLIDVLVVSEEAGVAKPDPRIFEIALERLRVSAGEAVMVGDSWSADVMGARACGIAAVWFNPRALPRPAQAADVPELRALEPPDQAIAVIRASHANRR